MSRTRPQRDTALLRTTVMGTLAVPAVRRMVSERTAELGELLSRAASNPLTAARWLPARSRQARLRGQEEVVGWSGHRFSGRGPALTALAKSVLSGSRRAQRPGPWRSSAWRRGDGVVGCIGSSICAHRHLREELVEGDRRQDGVAL